MSIVSFARKPITIIRPGVTLDHGALVSDWTKATESISPGWSIQPGSGASDDIHRDGDRIDWTGYGPPDADITATDRVRLPDGEYVLTVEPERHESPSGRISHTVIRLQRWKER